MDTTFEEVKQELESLCKEAEEKKLWIHCHYQNLWFTPNELRTANADGRFIWGRVNFTLRDPQEKLDEIDRQIERLNSERSLVLAKIEKALEQQLINLFINKQ